MDAANTQSVYQRALGERFAALDPRLRAYFGPIAPGSVGSGQGAFDVVGPTVGALRPLLLVLAWRHVLFPESGRGVPFTVRNEARADGTLTATRIVSFPGRTRTMQDVMTVRHGQIVDRLGRRGGLEITLAVAVVDAGLRLRSTRWSWRLGRLRLPLSSLARVSVDERIVDGLQRVDARVRAPLLGEVFRYTGPFNYAVIRA